MFFFLSLSFSLGALGGSGEYWRSKESVVLGSSALFCLVVRLCIVCCVLYARRTHTWPNFHINQKQNGQYTISPKAFQLSSYTHNYPAYIFHMPHISHAIYLICLINISCVLCFFLSNISSHGVWMGVNSVDMRYTPLHFF